MKIMTYNILSCRRYPERVLDFSAPAKVIRELDADVVGLNEVRDAGPSADYDAQTEILSELCDMPQHYFAKAVDIDGENPYGNALISRIPLLSCETIRIPDPNPRTGKNYYETRCLLKAKLAGDITVLVTHFGLNRDEQENAVRTVLQHLTPERCILMGDFNVRPDNDILDPLRARLKDTAEVFEKPLCSFPSDAPDRKIDYIFVTPDVEILSADIPRIVSSDHCPHTAELKL